jgi:hypothetical protein
MPDRGPFVKLLGGENRRNTKPQPQIDTVPPGAVIAWNVLAADVRPW